MPVTEYLPRLADKQLAALLSDLPAHNEAALANRNPSPAGRVQPGDPDGGVLELPAFTHE
ncbi:MAG: hypothetical protein DLM60_04445 [Pseudonocardiales bacterium]|nr:hypothetical protein [Actinomycetota bacterium]PZS22464.1 MAG: hypothetical protein DLM60_04445 [Pseudonocardiales bacterium]